VNQAGAILVADDEETFREATCRLLQRSGYHCEGARDSEEAIELLHQQRFDLLIADIRMPSNPDLRVVREARDLDAEMAVILVTGYPSIETAIRSVELSIMAYLVKPVNWDEVERHAREAVARSRRRRALSATCERLETVLRDLDAIRQRPLPRRDNADEVTLPIIRALASSLSQLLILASRTGASWRSTSLCALLDCSQRGEHREAIEDAIEVLKATKGTFKSKQLAELRHRLESVIEQ